MPANQALRWPSPRMALTVALLLAGTCLVALSLRALFSGDSVPLADSPFAVGDTSESAPGLRLPVGGPVEVSRPLTELLDAVEEDAVDDSAAALDDMPPDHLAIPALGIMAPVGSTPVVDGVMEVPDDVQVAARYDDGGRPGGAGTLLVAGHVNSRQQGPGVFAQLHLAEPGMLVVVTDDQGVRHHYAMTGLDNVAKGALPAELFTDRGPHRLAMVTCGGDLVTGASGDRTHADNVVATAQPLTAGPVD